MNGILLPFKIWIDDHTLGHERSTVALVERKVGILSSDRVAKTSIVPLQRSYVRPRIGVQEKFIRIETMPLFWFKRPVYSKAINGARMKVSDIAVPNFIRVFRKFYSLYFLFAASVEQTQLDFSSVS